MRHRIIDGMFLVRVLTDSRQPRLQQSCARRSERIGDSPRNRGIPQRSWMEMVDRTKPVCPREDIRDPDHRDSSHLRESLDQGTIPQIDLDIDPSTNTTRLIGVVETENVELRD